MTVVVILIIVMQLVDAYTTMRILKSGRELNPALRWLFSKAGMVPVLMVKFVAVGGVGIWLLNGGHYLWLGFLLAVYAVVIANNVIQLRKG